MLCAPCLLAEADSVLADLDRLSVVAGGAVHRRGPDGDLEASGERRQVIGAEGSGRCGVGLPGNGQRLVRVSGGAHLAGEFDPGAQRLAMSRTIDSRAI